MRKLALVDLGAGNRLAGDAGQGYIPDRAIRSTGIHESKDVWNNMTDRGRNRYGASEPDILRERVKNRSGPRRLEERICSFFHDTRE